MRRTKIICTLGPSTDSYETMVALVKAGMNVCGVYDKSSEEYAEDIKEVTDYYIFNFKELLGQW